MRCLALPLFVMLAACGKGAEKQEPAPEPVPSATAPAPRTPVMQITPAAGEAPAWLEPRPHEGPNMRAPYGELLDKPVVEKARR